MKDDVIDHPIRKGANPAADPDRSVRWSARPPALQLTGRPCDGLWFGQAVFSCQGPSTFDKMDPRGAAFLYEPRGERLHVSLLLRCRQPFGHPDFDHFTHPTSRHRLLAACGGDNPDRHLRRLGDRHSYRMSEAWLEDSSPSSIRSTLSPITKVPSSSILIQSAPRFGRRPRSRPFRSSNM